MGAAVRFGGRAARRLGRLVTGVRHGVAGLGRRLATGIPRGLVAVAAIVVLGLTLYTVATREPEQAGGYAEFTMFRLGCLVDPHQRRNVTTCERIAPLTYRVHFTRSLVGSTVLATRGICCPGQIRASIGGPRAVLVTVPKTPNDAHPIRASVFVP